MSSLGLPGWFRHAYFDEYHSHVRLRFKLAAGSGQPWTRDGDIPQGCPLSMMFIVALYLPWCSFLGSKVGVQLQLYADNLKCVSRDPEVLLSAARFTTGYVRLVGQELPPSKCVLMSTSRVVRSDMRGWVVSDEGHQWSVKLDVRDLGCHLDTTFHGWSSTLASRVRLVISRLVLVSALPLDFHGRLRVLRSMFIPGALHGIEASFLAGSSLRKLRTAFVRVAWSRRQSFASIGAVLSLLDGPSGCDPAFCVVWFRFRMFRRYLAYHPGEVFRVYRLLERSAGGCPGHGPVHLLLQSASTIGFHWDSLELAWSRPGLPLLSNLSGPFQHFRAAILGAWRDAVSAQLCTRKGFRGGPLFDIDGTLQLLNSDHVRERDKALLRSILVGGVWNGFLLGKVRSQEVPCRFCGVVTLMVIFSGIVLFHLLLRSVNILSFMILWSWIRLLGLGASFGMVGYPFSLELMVVLLGLLPLMRVLLVFWSVRLGSILLASLLSGSYLLILMLMVLLLGSRMILMFGLMVVWLMIRVLGFLLLVRVVSPFGIAGFGVTGIGVIWVRMFVMILWLACRGSSWAFADCSKG